MCVILIAEDKKPSEEMINKAYAANSHGAGIAWREPAEDGDGFEVVWKKGLSLEDIKEISKNVPLPQVLHFRIASSGGQAKELTHPFPISVGGENYLEGRTKGGVLFHNGHWSQHKSTMLQVACSTGKPMPVGRLSDTKAMAWCTAVLGRGFVDYIEEKGVAFYPTDMTVYWGTGWSLVDDVWVSNTHFQTSGSWKRTGDVTGAYNNYDTRPMCTFGRCTERNNLDKDRRCPDHTKEKLEGGGKSDSERPTPAPQGQPAGANATTNGKLVAGSGGSQLPAPFVNWQIAQRNKASGKIKTRAWKRAKNAFKEWIRQEQKKAKKNGSVFDLQGLIQQAAETERRLAV